MIYIELWVCPICNKSFKNVVLPVRHSCKGIKKPSLLPIINNPTTHHSNCMYRGDFIEKIECRSCGGKVFADKYQCSINDECTIDPVNADNAPISCRVCKSHAKGFQPKIENTMNQCQCSEPGFCSTMNKEMNSTAYSLCSSNPTIFEEWYKKSTDIETEKLKIEQEKITANENVIALIDFYKQGGADMQSITGMGDLIEKGLKQFNITPDLVKRVLNIEECGCEERKQWLNRIFPFV